MHATKRRVWPLGLLALAAFFLLGSAWAIALPVNGTYDENQHIVRAYAVVTGQWLPTGHGTDAAGLPAETFDAPRSLLPANAACTWKHLPGRTPLPASCQRPVHDRADGRMPSQAARYSPVYYLMVGLPLRLAPDYGGVVAARLLSALLSAAMLAAAVAVALRSGNRLLLAAVILVSTPLAMNLDGAVNPNGLEISAGVLLFAALLTLLRAPERPDAATNRWLLAAVAVAAVPLITLRQLGPVLLGCVVAACLPVARRDRLGEALRARATWLGAGLPAAVAVGFAGWWLLYSRVTDLAPVAGQGYPYGVGEILARLPGERFRFYAEQLVARFSYGETTVSPLLVAGWYALVAALVLPRWLVGWRRGRRGRRVRRLPRHLVVGELTSCRRSGGTRTAGTSAPVGAGGAAGGVQRAVCRGAGRQGLAGTSRDAPGRRDGSDRPRGTGPGDEPVPGGHHRESQPVRRNVAATARTSAGARGRGGRSGGSDRGRGPVGTDCDRDRDASPRDECRRERLVSAGRRPSISGAWHTGDELPRCSVSSGLVVARKDELG
jgi:hypothetical protein